MAIDFPLVANFEPFCIMVVVTVPVSPVVISVPVVAGRVIVVVPAVEAGCNVTVPLVLPGKPMLVMPESARFALARFSAMLVVPIKVVSVLLFVVLLFVVCCCCCCC